MNTSTRDAVVTFVGEMNGGYGWVARLSEGGGVIGASKPLHPQQLRLLSDAYREARDALEGEAVTIPAPRPDNGIWQATIRVPFKVTKLRGTVLRENPMTGARTIAYPGHLLTTLAEHWGVYHEDALKRIRGGRINAKGQLTFRCGGGYDVLSADLLDGSADGKALRDFEDATGLTLSY